MIHPLLRLVATQPHLLADHAEAYAGLVGDELSRTTQSWKRKAIAGAIGLVMLGVALVLAGVALMFWAVTPPANIQAPWALLAGPGVPALIGVICLIMAGSKGPRAFGDLRQQMQADLAMLRDVGAAH